MIFSSQSFRSLRLRVWHWHRTLVDVFFYNPLQQVAPHFPEIDWTRRDNAMAEKEGWCLFECEGFMEIQCDSEYENGEPPFSSDQEAIAHVDRQARRGSRLHQRALHNHLIHRNLRDGLGINVTQYSHCITDESLRRLNPLLDAKDFGILQDRARQLSNRYEPMVGDFVEFSPPVRKPLQIAELNSWEEEVQLFHIRSSDLLEDEVVGTISNGPTIKRHRLVDTGRTQTGDLLFWHHDLHPGALVTAHLPCKVWIASPYDLEFPHD